jgi:phage terminase large subunit GpA-like protein
MASEFLDAKRSDNAKEALRVWTNTFLAETYREQEDIKQDHNLLAVRRETYTQAKIPRGIVTIHAGADVQADRIEYEIVGFGPREESWGIEHGILPGDPRQDPSTPGSVWQQLEARLSRTFTREDGAQIKVQGVGIDSGFALAIRSVYAFIRPRQAAGYRAMKGASTLDAPLVARAKMSKVDRVNLLMVGVNRIKSLIYDRALLGAPPDGAPPSGYMHFPSTYTVRWFEQLLSEDSRPVFKSGVVYREFYVPTGEGKSARNEALDMRVYALASLYNRPTNWEYEEAQNLATKPQANPETQHQAQPMGFIGHTASWL